MKPSFPYMSASSVARLRVARLDWEQLQKLVFQRHPNREWGSYFRFGYRRTNWGLALSFVDNLPPGPGDLSRRSPIVSFSPDYISHALDEREHSRLGIGFVHSHPQGWGVTPSSSDDDMDEYFARLSRPYGSDQPYVSLILNRDADGRAVFSGRAFDCGKWMPVSDLFIVGPELQRYRSALVEPLPMVATAEPEGVLARWAMLVGKDVLERCIHATVGVVGCSGTGSPAIEVLARAQISNFVLVDSQRLSHSNLERMHGTYAADMRQIPAPYKVEIMARMIREINPAAQVTQLVGNALDNEVLDELLRCDFVLGCTDTLHGRALLGDLASLYFVPAIDVGVLPHGRKGRVISQLIEITRLGAADPCPFCLGRIPVSALNVELMSADERLQCQMAAAAAVKRGENGGIYWNGEPPQLPAVGYLTTTAGAMAAGYGLNWLLGTAEMPHQRMQFDLGAPEFAFVAEDGIPRQSCGCSRWRGYGDIGERSVTMPSHFPATIKIA